MARIGYICGLCNTYNRSTDACSKCSVTPSFARAPWQGVQIGAIDGESPGYYPSDTGWRKDPTNPAKRICPGKRAVYDYNVKKQDGFLPGKGGFME